jgi:hypothetical protein
MFGSRPFNMLYGLYKSRARAANPWLSGNIGWINRALYPDCAD